MAKEANILVVDDEPKICQFLETLLQREGHRVTSVHRGTDALARIEQETYDLIITDLKMPGIDGLELVSRVKAIQSTIPVVMVTGYATVETAVKAMRHGADDYVTKPFNLDELRKVVDRTLQAAQMERENRELVRRLQQANAELARHRSLLSRKVKRTGSQLVATRSDLAEHKEQLAVLSQLGALVTTEHDLRELFSQVLSAVNKRLDARYSTVMLRDREALVVRASEGEDGREIIGTRQPIDLGIAGRAAREQRAFLIKDLSKQNLFPPSPGRVYRTGSFISAPISHGGRLLGVINVGDKRNGKPFDEMDLDLVVSVANQIAPSIENAALYRAIEERCAMVIEALANTLEAKDRYTSGHSRRVGDYACALGRAAGSGEAELELLRRAAQLHDIGKIGLSDLILNKPARLTENEQGLVRTHPSVGERIIHSLDFLAPTRSLIRHHHERMDGKGYPDGVADDDIPPLARMLTIADAFDAMTSERPYRPAMSIDAASDEVQSCAGVQFDEHLAGLFCDEVIPETPVA